MHISFTFKNFEPSEHLRKYARRRMEKLGRFFGKNPALDAQVTGRDHFSPKPMSPDEAAMQLDANDFEFLTFLNSENDRINVIYRRKNGNLGLIDPIF